MVDPPPSPFACFVRTSVSHPLPPLFSIETPPHRHGFETRVPPPGRRDTQSLTHKRTCHGRLAAEACAMIMSLLP